MNATCAASTVTSLHYIVVAILQVITVFVNFRFHLVANKADYNLPWIFQDLFLLCAGCKTVFVIVGCGGLVTIQTASTVRRVLQGCKRGVFINMQEEPCNMYSKDEERSKFCASHASSALIKSAMQGVLTGYNFGGLSLAIPQMIMFSWALFCLLVGVIIQVLVNLGAETTEPLSIT